jgi:hypothetical protein
VNERHNDIAREILAVFEPIDEGIRLIVTRKARRFFTVARLAFASAVAAADASIDGASQRYMLALSQQAGAIRCAALPPDWGFK